MVRQVTDGKIGDRLNVEQVATLLKPETVVLLQRITASLRIDDAVLDYTVRLVRATRTWAGVVAGAGPRGGHLPGQALEPLLADGGHQAALVGEVVVGGVVADARLAGHLPQAQRLDPLLLDQGQAGVQEGAAEIAVVIAAPGGCGGAAPAAPSSSRRRA